MKYAIIADIHGNLEAFRVVLEDIRAQHATHVVCLGDVVGYNANPKECLQIVRDMNIPVVKGNHDEYCSTEKTTSTASIRTPPKPSIGRATSFPPTTNNGCAI
jgi:predicted phosphodiesterase